LSDTAEYTEGATDEGQRLHPLGLLIGFVTGLPQLVFPILAAMFGARKSDSGLGALTVVAIVLFASLFFRWIAWLRTHYHVGVDDIRIERGLISRTARSIPYDRIQDVSIEQKPLARLFGLGEVKFETGGGEGDDAKLSFVSLEEAGRLRETIRARKSGIEVAQGAAEELPDAPPVFAMDTKRLVTLGLYSFSLIIFAILGGAAQQLDFLLPFDFWDISHWIGIAKERGVALDTISWSARIFGALTALIALIFIGFASGIIRTFLTDYGFRLDRTAKGFRRRRGLLTRTDIVMPVARVQAAVISTGPVRKRNGWHALQFVSLAQESKEESHHMVAPLATLDEIWPIVLEAGIAQPTEMASFRKTHYTWWASGLVGLTIVMILSMTATMLLAGAPFDKAGWMLLVPLLFVPVTLYEWRLYGDHVDARQLYVRQGWWRQKLDIAPQVKIQSVEIAQGPIARFLGLAKVHFGIAGGTLSFAAVPLAEARRIRDLVMASVAPVDFSEINQRG
jgi:putative membrane protein